MKYNRSAGRGLRKPKEEKKAFYAINLSRINAHQDEKFIGELGTRLEKATNGGMSTRAIMTPLITTGAAYGPFEDSKGALMMAASDLDDKGRDFFGIYWGIVETKMTEDDYQRPLVSDVRKYICTDNQCKAVQRFKGSCAKCKGEGKTLIPTIEVRDWDGELNAA